mmetsp:Transcript_93474/g.264345  ORF Transcript_93474/g.264345 Transcript_93474/m.264345 type:complete len:1009 (-) Transcript_93474:88-3114(-)
MASEEQQGLMASRWADAAEVPLVVPSDDVRTPRSRRPRATWPCGMAALALALAAACVATWLATRRPLVARLRGAAELEEEAPGEVDTKPKRFCSKLEKDTEYHTRASLAVLRDIGSAEMCCAECDGNPECGAWTWGERTGVKGLTHHCFLKRLDEGEQPRRVKRHGIVSGLPASKLRKHGVVAQMLAGRATAAPGGGDRDASEVKMCPGALNLEGHGTVSIVSARWHEKGERSGRVEVPEEEWAVAPHLRGRAYFAEGCSAGGYNRSGYTALRLLGKTLRYTTDLSGVGCGCDAQLRLVPMQQNANEGECGDFFCSSAAACGVHCAELSIQDANQFAWSTSVHVHDDKKGASVGYGGGFDKVGRRDWTDAQYGLGAECVDTSWPFEVAISFPVDKKGSLEAVEVRLTQEGRPCSLEARVDRYSAHGRDGLEEIHKVLRAGVTPAVGYESSADTAWLDGLGPDGRGPCARAAPEACPSSVHFYDFGVLDAASARVERAPEPAPSSPFETAISIIHDRVEHEVRVGRRQRLANATTAGETVEATKVISDSNKDCGSDCDASGVGVLAGGHNITFSRQHGRGAYAESKAGNLEWEVATQLAHVRSTRSFKARILTEKLKGTVVVGKRDGEWIKLLREPGYIAISREGFDFLKERRVSYQKVISGSCADKGLFPIANAETCEAAAFSLGYFVVRATRYAGKERRPEGCYLFRGNLYMATSESNRGHGALGERAPICGSMEYPTTMTTTFTTSTRTTTTRTLTSSTTTSTTTTSSTTWGSPSLFCYEVMQTTTYEFGLVKEQIRRGVGVFTCDEYAVFSQDDPVSLGQGPNGPPIRTIWFKKAPVWTSQDNTAANTLLFMHIWEAVKKDGRWEKHHWTIKADPDAVVLPWRIRKHLSWATGPRNYLVNCNKYPGNANFPMIYGAFEAFSRGSLQSYFEGGGDRCAKELPWKMWGEDFYMHHCMKHLGIAEYDDFQVLSDKRCMGANCGDGIAGAYHDFKDQNSWFQCWDQAVR